MSKKSIPRITKKKLLVQQQRPQKKITTPSKKEQAAVAPVISSGSFPPASPQSLPAQPAFSVSNQVKISFLHHFSYGKMMMLLNAFAGIILGVLIALFISWLGPLPNKDQNLQISMYNALGWWNIVILPIVYGILALATGVLIAGIYNFIVKKGGGIRATIVQKGEYQEVRQFNVLDVGIIEGIFMAIVGLGIGLFLGSIILIGGGKYLGLRIGFFSIFIIIFPIIYAILGFIMGVIMAFFYNLAAKMVGGLAFLYKNEFVGRLKVTSFGLVYMILFLYVGFIIGFIAAFIGLLLSIFGTPSGSAGTAVFTFFGIWLLVTLICTIVGFLTGVLGALLYNLAAKIVGGIRMRLE